jgi:hypothetical protein
MLLADEQLHDMYLQQCLPADVAGLGDRILALGGELAHGVAVRPLISVVRGTTPSVKSTSSHATMTPTTKVVMY